MTRSGEALFEGESFKKKVDRLGLLDCETTGSEFTFVRITEYGTGESAGLLVDSTETLEFDHS